MPWEHTASNSALPFGERLDQPDTWRLDVNLEDGQAARPCHVEAVHREQIEREVDNADRVLPWSMRAESRWKSGLPSGP